MLFSVMLAAAILVIVIVMVNFGGYYCVDSSHSSTLGMYGVGDFDNYRDDCKLVKWNCHIVVVYKVSMLWWWWL